MDSYLQLLGLKVRDRVVGHEGVVTSVCFDLYGCVQGWVQPPIDKESKDGKPREGSWLDVKRLEVVDSQHVMPAPDFAVIGTEPGPETKSSPHGA